MARTRKVSQAGALQAAIKVFWRHGYGALGTRQLEAETGITRFTLQSTYGGKMALFTLALDQYLDLMETEMLPSMADGTLEGLARWFEARACGDDAPEGSQWGCMMIAAINEFGTTEPDITVRANRFQKMLFDAFSRALARVHGQGGLPPGLNREAAAHTLVAAAIGLNVVIRGGGNHAAGKGLANGVATVIRGWSVPT